MVLLMSSILTQQITWTTKTPLPAARAGAACAVVNDTIYVIGGRGSSAVQYKTNYVYDPIAETWATKTEMPTARGHISAAVVNGIVYVFGGWVGAAASGVVEAYDPVADSWETKTAMPTPRYGFCCGVVDGKVYVIGGMDMQSNIFNTVEEYDPSADTVGGIPWTTKTNMPTQRMGPACAVINDSIFVFGGSTSIGGGLTPVHQCYDPAADSWTTRTSLSQARYALGGLMYDNEAYAIGGYDYYSYRTEVEVFNPFLNSWSYETPMLYGRQSVSVALIGNKIYVIGGWNNGALDYNEEGTLPTGVTQVEDGPEIPEVSIAASPNPFSEYVSIGLEIEEGSSKMDDVSLQIFDVSGRTVREFSLPAANSLLHAGVVWDGKDGRGKLLPRGTYIVRICGNGFEASKTITIVR